MISNKVMALYLETLCNAKNFDEVKAKTYHALCDVFKPDDITFLNKYSRLSEEKGEIIVRWSYD